MKPLRSTYPRGHLLHPDTVYVPAVATNLRETFARISEQQAKVKPIGKRRVA